MTRTHRTQHLLAAAAAISIIFIVSQARAGGYDFIEEAKAIYRVAACGPGDVPKGIDAGAVQSHCARMEKNMASYRENFIAKAGPFFAGTVPSGLPRSVVVPFGGGDLLPALVVYPDATEITTISLESAGDPRRLMKSTRRQLDQALNMYRSNVGYMLLTNDNSNDNIRNMDRGAIPNQLAFSLTALAILGYEPVSLKYFRIEEDGSLHYYSKDEVASLEKVRGQRLKGTWIDTDFSVAFRNMELAFRKRGGGRTVIHRHVAFNLDNGHFNKSPLQRHLERKGSISAMIKGASYLPWFENFSAIRNYCLGHMTYCVSDSTGILPKHAADAGFRQVTYGSFSGAFLENEGGSGAAAMRDLFRSQPSRPLNFRFGYSDVHKLNHLVITSKR
ncbi:MAG TPA: hypothetical protein PLM53_11840 [Spirochaetota bacterium]|nr:hypothetical protein [Spirochaetota bacterium]HPC43368.1 hypothetical protein [Spirochaetota bacterium]HPL16485.1 hypothetical protein [Spirochaetota bacterium]HQF09244.1 hypothetical protein [Spirochaetota bacterium]HQH97785.1 hypothetical protein [Spirochaetota bacterium]